MVWKLRLGDPGALELSRGRASALPASHWLEGGGVGAGSAKVGKKGKRKQKMKKKSEGN